MNICLYYFNKEPQSNNIITFMTEIILYASPYINSIRNIIWTKTKRLIETLAYISHEYKMNSLYICLSFITATKNKKIDSITIKNETNHSKPRAYVPEDLFSSYPQNFYVAQLILARNYVKYNKPTGDDLFVNWNIPKTC